MKRRFRQFLEKNNSVIVPLILLVIVALIIFGEFRRNSAVIELKNSYAVSRRMLNARAQIQIILINANLEGRRLSASDIDQIKTLWNRAEYDLAETDE